ncbi:MFS multidrug transporter [Pochonia chlamydosporia 170]|uniref:MFS multidrug transporter n=1 Tax=Pochonia chlamydosporia 170 TaxID=1380566 RepID=A0A179FJZ5_METCM|nr:MFS multidrug transporter [Pochonia chlamydosporia 170]OAQ65329.2 MFS multidrug transporter [Pochonia chlamydosporia 170]
MAVTVFTLSVFIGPMVAPFIGGFILSSHLGWRWTQYLSGILASAAAVLNFLFVRESYPPIILSQKAAELRRRTKNWAIHAKQEEVEVDFKELLERNFTRPLHMLAVEPIVLLISLYSSFIYGLLYLFLTAYPVIFQGVYGMKPGVSGLPELGVVIGCLCTGVVMILRLPVYRRKLERNENIPIPEWRLPEAMFGGIIFAGGMFWLGWAGYRSQVHWIVPTIGGAVAGFGISMVFLQAFNYLIDSYLMLAASALAANTFLRSLFGGISPLFASYMFKGMGINWALTLLGCVASLFSLVPFVFYFKGPRIRQISRYTPKININVPASTPEEKV